MSFEAIKGSLLDASSGILVHGCNAKGVMGSGIAKLIRAGFPENYVVYRKAFKEHGLSLGQVIWFKLSDNPKRVIANAITQQNYGRDPNVRYVDYDAIKASFNIIAELAKKYNLPVHYPKIGGGLGNGDWTIIKPIIDDCLDGLTHKLWIPENEWDDYCSLENKINKLSL